MAHRRYRHDVGFALSIEGMGITQKRSLPIITKKKNVVRKPTTYLYKRRTTRQNKRLAQLNTKAKTQQKRSQKISGKKRKKAAPEQSLRAAPAAAANLTPAPAPTPARKPITLHEKALWLLNQKADPGRSGEVMVLYSHYKALFKVHNGKLMGGDRK